MAVRGGIVDEMSGNDKFIWESGIGFPIFLYLCGVNGKDDNEKTHRESSQSVAWHAHADAGGRDGSRAADCLQAEETD